MLHFFWNFGAFIVALGILVTVHEFGHFLVARGCGVKVERFSIGFGPALWRRYDKHGTEYTLAAIPLGGYIKMLDGHLDTVAPEHRHQAFNYKTAWARALIILSGPIFNLFFAMFTYWIIFLIGIPAYKPVIGEIAPHSIAALAEVSPGMELKSVDGIETPDWDSVRLELIQKIGSAKTTLGLGPFGASTSELKTLDLRSWQFRPDKEDIIINLGIIPLRPSIEPVLSEVQSGSAAMRAGLQVGDRIIKVDDQPVATWKFFAAQVRKNPGRMLRVGIDRRGNPVDITLQPDSRILQKGQVEGIVGAIPKITPPSPEYKTIRRYNPISALAQAAEKTWQLIKLTLSMLGKLLNGSVKASSLGGPISMAQGAGMSAQYGLIYYLTFLALISINLGIVNLFPLPVLDGGHLLFLAIEKLKGGAVSKRVENFGYRIGSILLLLLLSLALFNDFSRL